MEESQLHAPKPPPGALRLDKAMAEHGDRILRLCFLYLRDQGQAEDADGERIFFDADQIRSVALGDLTIQIA